MSTPESGNVLNGGSVPGSEAQVADLCVATPVLPPDSSATFVLETFHRTHAPAIALTGERGLEGLIIREAWMDRFSGPFALALWGRDPAINFAATAAVIQESATLDEVACLALQRPAGERYLPVAVLRGSAYRGIIDYRALVEALLHARDRALDAQLRAERETWKLQRLDSLGTLAGGISHDFNNILGSVLGLIGVLKFSPLDNDTRETLGLIEQAVRRAGDVTSRLLAFARGGLARMDTVNLVDVINETMALAGPTMAAGIRRSIALPAGRVLVDGDFGQLQQAILNVLLNARDAMDGRGQLTVSLWTDGDAAIVCVADSGPGIPLAVQERIFEPFFTTKPVGFGTGMGLAVTYGIVQGHGGQVTFDTVPGEGTRFFLRLPLACPQEAQAAGAPGGPVSATVLVVDDEPIIRRAGAELLRHAGFQVLEAPSGADALHAVRTEPERFAAVLLDLVMPGIDGRETYTALQAIRPDLPVIVWTGFALDGQLPPEMRRNVQAVLRKPVDPDYLIAEFRRVVSSPPAIPRTAAVSGHSW